MGILGDVTKDDFLFVSDHDVIFLSGSPFLTNKTNFSKDGIFSFYEKSSVLLTLGTV